MRYESSRNFCPPRLDDSLYHYGIHGQRWGVRRFQNEDGTLTEEGKKRYNYGDVTVERTEHNGNEDYYKLTQKGRKSTDGYMVKGSEFREVERMAENHTKKILANSAQVPVQFIDYMVETGQIDRKTINEFIDETTRNVLVEIMDQEDKAHVKK